VITFLFLTSKSPYKGAGYMVRGSKSYASPNLTTPAYASTIKEKDAAALTLLKMFIRPSAGPGISRRMGRTDFAPAYAGSPR
jgi:hypothetical protein